MTFEEQEYEIQRAVERAVRLVHVEAASVSSCAAQSLILARVVKKLLESMVIERQADVTKALLLKQS
jgi:hypothetical protein